VLYEHEKSFAKPSGLTCPKALLHRSSSANCYDAAIASASRTYHSLQGQVGNIPATGGLEEEETLRAAMSSVQPTHLAARVQPCERAAAWP